MIASLQLRSVERCWYGDMRKREGGFGPESGTQADVHAFRKRGLCQLVWEGEGINTGKKKKVQKGKKLMGRTSTLRPTPK